MQVFFSNFFIFIKKILPIYVYIGFFGDFLA